MKRIIRLTESDLTRIVKRVLKESKNPKSITIELTEVWENHLRDMKSGGSYGYLPLNSEFKLLKDIWVMVGLGPYEYKNYKSKDKQTFFFAEYVPDNNEILVHSINCFGPMINKIANIEVGRKEFFSRILNEYGVSSENQNDSGFCVRAGFFYCKFEDGFEVGKKDHRGYFQIVDTSEPKESEEEPLSERYYRRKI